MKAGRQADLINPACPVPYLLGGAQEVFAEGTKFTCRGEWSKMGLCRWRGAMQGLVGPGDLGFISRP